MRLHAARRLARRLISGTPGVPARADRPVPVAHMLDQVWCDRFGVYVAGWIHAHAWAIDELALTDGEARTATTAFSPRPDLARHYPDHPLATRSGFQLYLSCAPFQPVWLEAAIGADRVRVPVEVPPHLRTDPERAWDDTDHPWVRFVLAIRALPKATVLEVGARAVGAMTADVDTNPFGPHVAKISADIHPGPGVDVVADAHALSRAVAPGSVDGLFSVSVLEHLAAPWLAAAEMNRVLKPGGLVLHLTHHTWPLHEEPNDFFRFSDRGLAQLFGPATGFEVVEAGMRGRMRVHPSPEMRRFGWHDMPTIPGFGEAFVLARKIAEAPEGARAWPLDPERLAALSRLYPSAS